MKYVHKKTGKVVVNATFNEKFNTYILEFEDGSNTTVTAATVKRWYKKVEEEVKEESKTEETQQIEDKKQIENKTNSLSVLDTIANILDDLGVEYTRCRDGINAKVFTAWKRKMKARFYISEHDGFENIDTSLVENIHDNPTKNSRKNKSFYVPEDNLKQVIESILK